MMSLADAAVRLCLKPVFCSVAPEHPISYAVRIKRNVREADGTVVFSLDPILTGGSSLTFEYAAQVKKPGIHIHKSATDYSDEAFLGEVWRLMDFIESNQIVVLNVAGPRESNQPGAYAFALKMLRQYWENRYGPTLLRL
jgi:Circularly permutated YpsA SLOG family